MTSGVDRRATSDQATIDQRADTVLLTGNVVAVQGRNSMKGGRLFVDRTTGHTQLSSPGATGEAAGRIATRFFRGEQSPAEIAKQKAKQAAAALTEGANAAAGVFKTDPTAPIDVDASRLDVDDVKKQAVYRGDVRAVQGDFVVRTSEMRAFYTGAAGLAEQLNPTEKKAPAQVTRIEARGKVIVNSKNGQNATGDWADYDVKANQVVLGGDVILTQEKNVVRGTRLTIDMITGQSVIHNDPGAAWSATAAPQGGTGPAFTIRPSTGGRPSAIFYPRKKEKDSKAETPKAMEQPKQPSVGDGWAAQSP
jgi:lipopolysaccharide transport protein LptA